VDVKEYMKTTYSRYWISARETKYGFSEYDRSLCALLLDHLPRRGRILEVAIGTGYRFAGYFEKAGYSVYGIDVSQELARKCRELYPSIGVQVADAENLPSKDLRFDATYCFHSTWYFPDLNRAIGEMIRVTKQGGFVLFDLMNAENPRIMQIVLDEKRQAGGITRSFNFLKDILKFILRYGMPQWHYVVHTFPARVQDVVKFLKNQGLTDCRLYETRENTLTLVAFAGNHREVERLVFVLKK